MLALTSHGIALDPHHSIFSTNSARSWPVWVPANEAVNSAGVLDPQKLPNNAPWHDRTERSVSASTTGHSDVNEPCQSVTVFDESGFGSTATSIRGLVRLAKRVAVGTVIEIVPGFYDGLPASLIRMSVRSPSGATEGDAFFVYPSARFTANGRVFCRIDSQYAELPTVGDRVVLFGTATVDPGGQLFVPKSHEIIREHAGQLFMPRQLAHDPDLQSLSTFGEITTKLQLLGQKVER
jgi:hypothetical protein